MNDEALLNLAFELAARAGEIILSVRARGFTTERKADRSPVTEADRAAEAAILAGLRAATPEIAVVAEEAVAAGQAPAMGDDFWCVDPLDGTREFAGGTDDFAVCIGLVRGRKPVLGVIGAPVADALYGGIVGHGAVRRDAAGERAIAARAPRPTGLVVATSRHHGDDTRLAAFLAERAVSERVMLGSALKFCLIAEGKADLYPRFGTTMEWDTAAGQALVEAAGGAVQVLETGAVPSAVLGAVLGYAKPDWRNPHFCARGRRA